MSGPSRCIPRPFLTPFQVQIWQHVPSGLDVLGLRARRCSASHASQARLALNGLGKRKKMLPVYLLEGVEKNVRCTLPALAQDKQAAIPLFVLDGNTREPLPKRSITFSVFFKYYCMKENNIAHNMPVVDILFFSSSHLLLGRFQPAGDLAHPGSHVGNLLCTRLL